MGKVLLFLITLILSFLVAIQAQASEIFGNISTNPSENNPPTQNNSSGQDDSSSDQSSDNSNSANGNNSGEVGDNEENSEEESVNEEVDDNLENKEETSDEADKNEGSEAYQEEPVDQESPEEPIGELATSTVAIDDPKNYLPKKEEPIKTILGAKIYPDGTLLRGNDGRIFLVKAGAKKYITDLQELSKYRGREIITATNEELSCYGDRAHLEGELIRQRGDVKVYVVVGTAKKHVLNLEELRANYAGQEIFNIFPEEMAAYDN